MVLASLAVMTAVGSYFDGWNRVRGWFAPQDKFVKALAPGVYFRKAQTDPVFTGCNQGWVVFRDYVLVIDANFPGQVKEVIAEIRKTTDKPIRYVFDTHHHGDHADGNVHFVKEGAVAVAAERSRPMFETKGLQGFEQSKKSRGEEYGDLKYEMPSLYFPEKLIFDDGEQRVELLHLGHGHTQGDAVAWLPRHGILFTGDACVNGPFNYTGDSNLASWINLLGAFEELPVKVLAPGHGELGDKTVIALQKKYFIAHREAVAKLAGEGKSLEEIKKEIDIPLYKEWAGVDVKTRTENIEHAYKEWMAAQKPKKD